MTAVGLVKSHWRRGRSCPCDGHFPPICGLRRKFFVPGWERGYRYNKDAPLPHQRRRRNDRWRKHCAGRVYWRVRVSNRADGVPAPGRGVPGGVRWVLSWRIPCVVFPGVFCHCRKAVARQAGDGQRHKRRAPSKGGARRHFRVFLREGFLFGGGLSRHSLYRKKLPLAPVDFRESHRLTCIFMSGPAMPPFRGLFLLPWGGFAFPSVVCYQAARWAVQYPAGRRGRPCDAGWPMGSINVFFVV